MGFLGTVYGHPYMIIGVIVSALNLRAIARSLANSTSVWTGSYWGVATRENKRDPSIGDYIGAVIWSFVLIPLWPLTVAFRIWRFFLDRE